MNKIFAITSTLIALILLLAIALFQGMPFFAPSVRPAYEYTIISIPDESLESGVNLMGAKGWDMVTARRATSGSGYESKAAYEMIFKRQKGVAHENAVIAPTPEVKVEGLPRAN